MTLLGGRKPKTEFILCWHSAHQSAGTTYVHARLKTYRNRQETIVGVFQLTEEEWGVLVALCEEHNFPVQYEGACQ